MSFEITRSNNKSDAEVLADLVKQAAPGDLLSYEMLSAELSKDSARMFERRDVQGVVSRAERKIATEQRRALINVRGKGYRVALAGEHQMIAGQKRDRASTQLKRGLLVLQHVDWDAMDDNSRKAHEGQLMVVGALASAVDGMNSRLKRIEEAIHRSKG